MMPKPSPAASMSIGQPEVVQSDGASAMIRIPLSWTSEVQPTYITVDIQPVGAPEVIEIEDRNKYHLIRGPQNWVNTKMTFSKKANVLYDCLFELQGHEEFVIKAKLSNDDIKSTEALARAETMFSFTNQAELTS